MSGERNNDVPLKYITPHARQKKLESRLLAFSKHDFSKAIRMISTGPKHPEGGLTLLFGPQDPNLGHEFARQLRSTLIDVSNLQWILDALLELPTQWQTMHEAVSELQSLQGGKHLESLTNWLRTGHLNKNMTPFPNIILTPLVVAIHLVQYSALLNHLNPKLALDDNLPTAVVDNAVAVGLCTGLLTTAAVVSSATLRQLESNGTVAIRIAMAIGALVDNTDSISDPLGKWISLAVGWTSQVVRNKLAKVLEDIPEVYTLVVQ